MELKELCLLLKEAREKKGIPLKKAALYTKIPPSVIRKIEAGEKLESIGTFYLKGFLKIYASFLKRNDLIGEISRIFSSSSSPHPPKKKITTHLDAPQKQTDINPHPDFKLYPDFKNVFSKFNLGKKEIVTALCLAFILALFLVTKKQHSEKKAPLPVTPFKQEEREDIRPKKEENQEIITSILTKEKVFIQVKADNSLIFQNILIPGKQESWKALKSLEIKINSPKSVILEINGKIIPTSHQRKPATYKITPKGFKVEK